MVVRLQRFPNKLLLASDSNLWEPLTYSQYASGGAVSTLVPTPQRFLEHALKTCLLSAPPLQDNELTGSWLSALIYMDSTEHACNIESLTSWWQNSSESADAQEFHRIHSEARQACNSLQNSVNQVAAFSRSFPSARQADYHEAYHLLERLLTEVKNMTEDIKHTFDAQHQIKNNEVASLAVQESKSAIASMHTSRRENASMKPLTLALTATVLAFVFIPINMASSVYGMNVQEINETGHSIWGFVVTALVLLACSGLGWVLWRTWREGRLMALSRSFADWVQERWRGKRERRLYEY